jgi:hypothetical protein
MYTVYDNAGDKIQVEKYVDVKEMIASGHYIGFFENSKVREGNDTRHKKYISHINGRHSGVKSISVREQFFKEVQYNCSSNIRAHGSFATIISTADCVKGDIKNFGVHGTVFVVNDAGFYYPNFDHHVSHHGEILAIVRRYRRKFRAEFFNEYKSHSSLYSDSGLVEVEQNLADCVWKFRPKAISSGMLAIFIAIAIGYKHILVHGMPFSRTNHFYDFEETHVINQYDKFFVQAQKPDIIKVFENYDIRFSSGNFRKLTKAPSDKWIDDYSR